MKRILLFLLALAPLFAMAKDNKDVPVAKISEKVWDFGTVKENGGPVSHEFTVTNTGKAPLVIISATAACGCTKPSFSVEPIRPGKSGKIKVTYLPKGRPGEFAKNVKIRTNAPSAKKITVKITGTVVP